MDAKFQFTDWILKEFGVTPNMDWRDNYKPHYQINAARGTIGIDLHTDCYAVLLPGHPPTFYPYTKLSVVVNLFRANKWTRFYSYAQAHFVRDHIDYYIEDLVDYFGEASPDFMYPTMDSIMDDLELYYR